MICGSERSKSRLAKAAGAEPCGQMRDESYKVARRRGVKHISKSKCTKHTNIGPLLEVGSCDLEKVHAVVARSTFGSQMHKTPQLRGFGARLEVAMSKKRTPLRREAHLKVKKLKTI